MIIRIEWRPGDLEKIERLAQWNPSEKITGAIEKSLGFSGLQKTALTYMERNFRTTSGRQSLLEQFSTRVSRNSNQITGWLMNTAPHAWRREEGFSGKTDRLGRYFRRDPGIHYMRYALQTEKKNIKANVKDAVEETLNF